MKIVAMFAYCERDKHHVPGVLENLSWVDDIVAYDNSGKPYNEREMRLEMKRLAIEKGADWILELDPDERFEVGAAEKFREVTRTKHKTIYRVNFRELYTPDSYRVDGIWGRKHRYSLYPVYPDQKMWPVTPDYKRVSLDVNLYHLKMIEPQARQDRVDESSIELEKIPIGREYFPRYERRLV